MGSASRAAGGHARSRHARHRSPAPRIPRASVARPPCGDRRCGRRSVRTMNVPSDYLPGYEKARAVDPDVASCYIEHTTIGDPEADELTEALADLERQGVPADPPARDGRPEPGGPARAAAGGARLLRRDRGAAGLGRRGRLHPRRSHVPPQLAAGARRDGRRHARRGVLDEHQQSRSSSPAAYAIRACGG